MTASKGFDRSKFKGAKISSNKETVEEAKKNSGMKFDGGRAGYLKIGEGKTMLRIAPPHDENDPSLQPVQKAWLPRKVGDKDEIKNMPVFNSRTHSPIGRDIVDEYCAFITSLMYKEHSKDEAKKKLAAVNGYRTKDQKWVSGIRPTLNYVAYAWIGEELGRVEISRTIADRMNELSIDEEAEDPITMDPFSPPDTGVALILEFDPSAENNKKWKVNRGSKARPLTDEQLMELDKLESLASMFKNAYTREDYDHAVEGLRIFDAKNGYGVMEMEEFIDIMEEMQALVWDCPEIRESNKENEEEEEGGDGKAKAPVKTVKAETKTTRTAKPKIEDEELEEEEEAEEEEGKGTKGVSHVDNDDGLEDLDINELKEFVVSQKLDVVIKPAYPKSKVISLIREAAAKYTAEHPSKIKQQDDLPFDKKNDGSESTPKKGSFKDRMKSLKK